MSGHSKWATTKRRKGAQDAKRGAIFTRIANIITIAAREKGGDLETNFTLRMAVDKAKTANMPKENIERAIKRGTGEGDGAQIQEYIYEGIGPVNSQFIIKALSDNKNRSASEIRHVFSKFGGAFGAVMWNFEQKGVIRIISEELKNKSFKIEDLELELIDAGADDIQTSEEGVTILTKSEDLQTVKKFLDEKQVATESAEIEYVAKDEIEATGEDKEKIENFIEALEDQDDVADYYTNVNFA